jgi:hypothetical protein
MPMLRASGGEYIERNPHQQLSTDEEHSLLHSGRHADLTIKSGDHAWLAHKAIVCSRCEFFDRACTAGFKVSSFPRLELSSF